MPLGVPLATGVQLSVDGKEVTTVPFDVCRRDGCLADVLMGAAAVGAFKAGSQAQARVASPTAEGVTLPNPLTGFTAAIRRAPRRTRGGQFVKFSVVSFT